MAIDVASFVFAGCFDNASNSLSIFDPQAQVVHTIELQCPLGVAIAPDGSVWAAGLWFNKLWKF